MELFQCDFYDFVEGVVGSEGEGLFGNEFFEKAGGVCGGENLLCAVAVGFYKTACSKQCAAEPAGDC